MDDTVADRLERAAARIAALRPQVVARAPWPLAERFGTEPEAAWGPPEVLAHVAEMLGYWRGELERILDAPTDPVPFGRVANDPLRIGLIARDRTLPPAVPLDRIESGARAWRDRLMSLDERAAARRGVHPTLGELGVPAFVERFIVGHLEEHATQLERVLEGRRG